MLNFPVAGGTSGHLMGGMLAAVLVGPWLGALAVTVVLIVQCLLFADGGISALGLNIINIAFVPALVTYALFLPARRVLPASRGAMLGVTAVAALVSVLLALTGLLRAPPAPLPAGQLSVGAGMIAAAFGHLTPVQGALFQEVIDVAVILNALRALRISPRQYTGAFEQKVAD